MQNKEIKQSKCSFVDKGYQTEEKKKKWKRANKFQIQVCTAIWFRKRKTHFNFGKSHKDGVQFQFLYISRFRKRIREDYNQSNKVTVNKKFGI